MQTIKKNTQHSTLSVNLDLCYKIYKLHYKPGDNSLHSVEIKSHPLINKLIIRYSDGHEFNIQSVHKHWYAGWSIALLLEREKSHHLLYWSNISCIHPVIVTAIEESNFEYSIIG